MASPLPQVGFGGVAGGASQQSTTASESLTTPVISLATPNLFSSLPPLSSLTGDFPFGSALMGGGGISSGGDQHSALVAFPVSIQPSTSGGGASTSNIVLQAQNMGQPFLLTPNFDRVANPLLSGGNPSQLLTPPTSLVGGAAVSAGISPSPKDLETLKLQYDRLQQQLLQQQFMLQQGMQRQVPPLQSRDGVGGGADQASPALREPQRLDSAPRPSPFLSSSEPVLRGVPPESKASSSQDTEPSPPKRARLSASGV